MNELVMQDAQITYKAPDQKQLLEEADIAFGEAQFIVIDSEETLNYATEEMNACKKRLKELDAMRKSITKPMDEAKKAVMALFTPVMDRYSNAVTLYKRGISDYVNEQQRKAEEARRAEEEKALAQQAELAKALEVAEEAQQAEVASMIQEAMAATAVPVKVTKVEVPKGAVIRKKLRGNVVDMKAFLHFIADHPEFHHLVSVKQGELDRTVASVSGAIEIAGVTVTEENIVACKG